jgi:hypothetical protein
MLPPRSRGRPRTPMHTVLEGAATRVVTRERAAGATARLPAAEETRLVSCMVLACVSLGGVCWEGKRSGRRWRDKGEVARINVCFQSF